VLGAAVHLVGQDPRPARRRDAGDLVELRRLQDLPRRVVRRADADDLRARGHRDAQAVEVEPPPLVLVQPHLADGRAEPASEAVELHVVGHDHDDLVAPLDEGHEREEVRLARAGRDEDVIGGGAAVERGDERPRLLASRPLGVAETHFPQRGVAGGGAPCDEQVTGGLGERERLDPRLGEVVADAVLPRRLHPLHLEYREAH